MFKILIAVLVFGLFLNACSSAQSKAPVSDRSAPPGEDVRHHVVAKGETLYSIAWRYNLDYTQLARANGVGSDYNIHPGQKLSLDLSDPSEPASSAPATAPTLTPVKPVTKKLPKPPVPKARSINKSPVAPQSTKNLTHSRKIQWHWPAEGNLIATFSSNQGLNKGIDIEGELGDSVYAASAGKVVYAGSGLRGYGKLIIVKHSDKYLSAYAHSRQLLAREGDRVKSGEKIAEMGSTGTDTVKLHFEIRHDGKPVDPLRFLPRK